MEKMDGALDRPLSDAAFIASHLQCDLRSPDDPLYGILRSTKEALLFEKQAERAESATETGKPSQAEPIDTNLKPPASNQEITASYSNGNSIKHNDSEQPLSAPTTPATTAKPRDLLLQSQPPLPATLKTYYELDQGRKNVPQGRAKRASPGLPGYNIFFDLAEDLEEQFKAASEGLVAHGIPIDSPAGFDLWQSLDRFAYGGNVKKNVKDHEQAVTTDGSKEKDTTQARAKTGKMRTTGAQATNKHAPATMNGVAPTEVQAATANSYETEVSPFWEFIHSSPTMTFLKAPETVSSDADCEWEEDTEMLNTDQSHVQQ